MKVSVVIPTYNRAKLLVETLKTVIKQTFKDKEIIVVDDGSTDDTEHRIAPYLKDIQYIKQSNKGVNAARNLALEIAKGEYIALLDSDDLWMEFKLDLEVAVLNAHPNIGFVYSDFAILKPTGSIINNGIRKWYTYENDWEKLFNHSHKLPKSFTDKFSNYNYDEHRVYLGDIYHSSLFHPAVLPSASLYRSSMTKGKLVFNEEDSTCGDWEFFARLSKLHGAGYIDLETAYNRSHEDAVRLTRIDRKIILTRRVKLIERIWQADPEFSQEYSAELNNEQYKLYCDLIKLQLLRADIDGIKRNIQTMKQQNIKPNNYNLLIMKLLAYIPFSPFILGIFRRLKHMIM